jgi:peptidoglycan hydrolase-like protein with peptidoglycan-binding domain
MPISRICLFAGLFAIVPAVFAQEASPSPSAPTKPFVVDQTGAEKELKKEKAEKNATPTPTPDLRFPSNPIAPSTPAPQENASSNEPAVPRAEPVSAQEVLTRLQIFLDQRSFGPGKIDGRWGEFTAKALVRYQLANGQPPTGQIDPAMQQALSRIFPIYTDYTLTAEDLQKVGDVPSKPSEQAKKKAMLYRSVGEFSGERFHADPDFIAKLNKDKKVDSLNVGDTVRVPNVPEFKIEDVKEADHIPARIEFSKRVIKIDTRYRMLDVYDGDKIVCIQSLRVRPGYLHRLVPGKSLVSLHSLGSVGMKPCSSMGTEVTITSTSRPDQEIQWESFGWASTSEELAFMERTVQTPLAVRPATGVFD